MKIVYVCEKIEVGGHVEESSQEFGLGELIVGRGGDSKLVFKDPSLSLEHAKFILSNSSLIVEDLSNSAGVYVNDSYELKKTLNEQDIVKIGSKEFLIKKENDSWILKETVNVNADETRKEVVGKIVEELNILKKSPNILFFSLIAGLITLILFLLLPYFGFNKAFISPGKISNAHIAFEKDCVKCHSSSFSNVKNSDCNACHKNNEHHNNLTKLVNLDKKLDRDCVECHSEHKGKNTHKYEDSSTCINCHSNSSNLNVDDSLREVSNLLTHPEFKTDKDFIKHIKFNHQLHFAKNFEMENCQTCHDFSKKVEKSVSYVENCSSCHALNFDERLPNLVTPHVEPNLVFNFMYSEYAKLYLNEKPSAKSDFDLSKKPGYSKKVYSNLDERKFAKDVILAEARYSEQSLFEGGECAKCHNVSKLSNVDLNSLTSIYQVINLSKKKLSYNTHSFSHKKHLSVSCKNCHGDVASSKDLKTLTQPSIKNCLECHSDSGSDGKIETQCVDCHYYHGE